jgi:hypothetical protein
LQANRAKLTISGAFAWNKQFWMGQQIRLAAPDALTTSQAKACTLRKRAMSFAVWTRGTIKSRSTRTNNVERESEQEGDNEEHSTKTSKESSYFGGVTLDRHDGRCTRGANQRPKCAAAQKKSCPNQRDRTAQLTKFTYRLCTT